MVLAQKTAWELTQMLAEGKTSSVEIMRSVLDQIEIREDAVNAFLHVCDRKSLLAQAERVDQRRARGEKIGVLAGLPVAVKDNICTQDVPTTCASKMLANFFPPYDATVMKRLHEADGILLGKTNMDEFAMGSTTENSAFKTTHNPNDLDYVPGGTSGGSAAAVAANETILALGSDTGGSIRQPAAFCGVVGIKPTYGRVSRFGLIAYASSLDQIGVIGKDVSDAAMALAVIAGHDPRDSTSLNVSVPPMVPPRHFEKTADDSSVRLGIPEEYFGEGLDDEVRLAVEEAIRLLEQAGSGVTRISLPHTKYALPAYYVIACAEASSNLSRYDGTLYGFRSKGHEDLLSMVTSTRTLGFGEEVQRRIMIGTYTLSAGYYDAYYLKACKVRRMIANDFDNAFKSCDVLIHPISPTAPFRIGEKTDDPLKMYLSDVYSVVANLAGLPAITIPCGKGKNGLPIGIQLVGNRLTEPLILKVAAQLERLLADSGAWKRQ